MIESDVQPVVLKWPRAEDIDADRATFCYDRDSDILLVHFDGRGRAGVVDYVRDNLAVLVDVETDDVVGLQVEDFLARAVVEDPGRLELLDVAELRGITPHEVAALRRRASVVARKRAALTSLLTDYRSPVPLASLPGTTASRTDQRPEKAPDLAGTD